MPPDTAVQRWRGPSVCRRLSQVGFMSSSYEWCDKISMYDLLYAKYRQGKKSSALIRSREKAAKKTKSPSGLANPRIPDSR